MTDTSLRTILFYLDTQLRDLDHQPKRWLAVLNK